MPKVTELLRKKETTKAICVWGWGGNPRMQSITK